MRERVVLQYPKSWPLITWLFLGATMAFVAFGWAVEPSPDGFSYFSKALSVIVALAVVFFASRLAWWWFSLFGVMALGSWAGEQMASGRWFAMNWQSWGNVVLQALAVGMAFSPPMIRWIRPLGRSMSFKMQYALLALIAFGAGGYFVYNPLG